MAEIPAWPSVVAFQPSSIAGWAVTIDGHAERQAVAGWGTVAHENGTRTIEPMIADPRPNTGVIVRAADLGTVTKLEFIRPDPATGRRP